ncbi:phosphatase PAP2 family protein [Haliovirga abyssi]|uniref:Phosphatidic acid phosphatase type 2/haloperoxidase domain-containing protein n=1 Tax=Haliovirga abyssi TaxID=2996794 RepID=A0AAU9DFE2_9FUSO|nr:phosphatase PAP2 family protein [Haliovirga abyssi]BDU50918.1 hypothetical protein HLVA_14870 [Haliovirga abyssi]
MSKLLKPSIFLYILFIIMIYKLIKEGYWKNILKKTIEEIKKNYKILTVILIGVIFIIFFVDSDLSRFFSKINSKKNIFSVISELGNVYIGNGKFIFPFLLTGIIVGIILNLKKIEKIFSISLMSTSYAGLMVLLIKGVISRERPFVANNPLQFFNYIKAYNAGELFKFDYLSMPSGHTITAFATFIPFFLYVKNKYLKALFLFIPSIVLFSRVYTYRHWLSDVIVGAVLGSLVAYSVYENNKNKIIEEV